MLVVPFSQEFVLPAAGWNIWFQFAVCEQEQKAPVLVPVEAFIKRWELWEEEEPRCMNPSWWW